jgi:Na+/proline symporter
MARELLPAIMPGLIGVFLAALLASIMSSCDAFMVSSSGLFTQNFYRRYIKRDKPEGHYVTVGRIASFVIVCASIYFAFLFKDVPTALEWFFKVQAMMGAAFWLGLFWRGTTVAGAWAGTLVAVFITAFTSDIMLFETAEKSYYLWQFNAMFAEKLPEAMIWGGKFRLSFQLFFSLAGAFGTCILVSLVTPRVPKERLDRVFACLRTPIQPNEPHLEPFTLPPGVTPPEPKKLIDHPDFEIPVPTKEAVIGFLSFAAIVVALVGFVYWLFS